MFRYACFALALALALAPSLAPAQIGFMIPDSGTGDRVMLFDGNGNLTNPNWITDAGQPFTFTTPKEAMAVGGQVWVSDQVADAVHRFTLNVSGTPAYLGSITADAMGGTLDNIRGMGIHNDTSTVYLTRFHGTAALRGTVVIDANTATATGFLPAPTSNASLFDAEPFGEDLLVSNSTTDNIERIRKTDGALLGNFATGVTFPQQVVRWFDNSIITVSTIAAPGVEGIYHFNADGTLRRYIDTEPIKPVFGEHVPSGAWPIPTGYLLSTTNGIYRWNAATNDFTQVIGGVTGQFINPIYIPEPGCVSAIACIALLALRRRRPTA